ncbi:hypothetical protein B296_00044900 [Ensete ventricosum]|uniref:Secreted protein n=1 Tax=Ensete ventricosum TaxID=4639 RepID=A0A426Y0S8_ENSVE|nr:hypothetical protein B296_00044900 [Ensete ventricosum]
MGINANLQEIFICCCLLVPWLKAAGRKANNNVTKRTHTFNRAIRAVPPLEANAELQTKVCNIDGYRPYRAVRAGSPVDWNADCPLPGGTVNWGCFRPATTRNRLVTVDFDRRRPISDGICRGRKKKREKKKKNLETDATLLILIHRPRAISSPCAGRRNEVTRHLITHANAKSKSEKFPPPHQDGALGYPLESSYHMDPAFDPPETSFSTVFPHQKGGVTTWSGPLVDPAAVGDSGRKKQSAVMSWMPAKRKKPVGANATNEAHKGTGVSLVR